MWARLMWMQLPLPSLRWAEPATPNFKDFYLLLGNGVQIPPYEGRFRELSINLNLPLLVSTKSGENFRNAQAVIRAANQSSQEQPHTSGSCQFRTVSAQLNG